MKTVILTPFDVFSYDRADELIVRVRSEIDGKWDRTRFARFKLPVDVVTLFEYAYAAEHADCVYMQSSMLFQPKDGTFH